MRLWALANYCRAGIKSLRGTDGYTRIWPGVDEMKHCSDQIWRVTVDEMQASVDERYQSVDMRSYVTLRQACIAAEVTHDLMKK